MISEIQIVKQHLPDERLCSIVVSTWDFDSFESFPDPRFEPGHNLLILRAFWGEILPYFLFFVLWWEEQCVGCCRGVGEVPLWAFA